LELREAVTEAGRERVADREGGIGRREFVRVMERDVALDDVRDDPGDEVRVARVEAGLAANRLSHAYLIEGPQGLGKLHLAFRMAARVLEAPWPAEDPPIPLQHPDLTWVTLEIDDEGKQKKQIGIQQIRDTCARLAMTSYSGGWKVAVVWPAEQLNPHSANALLKTLEEPAPRTLLLLVRSRLDTLPATIASRCQRIRIAPPPPEEAIPWLEARAGGGDWRRLLALAGDAPLMALLLAEEGFRELDEHFTDDLLGIAAQRREPLEVAAEWARRRCVSRPGWRRWLNRSPIFTTPTTDIVDTFDVRCTPGQSSWRFTAMTTWPAALRPGTNWPCGSGITMATRYSTGASWNGRCRCPRTHSGMVITAVGSSVGPSPGWFPRRYVAPKNLIRSFSLSLLLPGSRPGKPDG
jgi:DNA polymerase-3 subunit delta'